MKSTSYSLFVFFLACLLQANAKHGHVITPNGFSGSDIERIRQAIAAAKGTTNKVVIPQWNSNGYTYWEIDSAILLPSNMTVILNNCTIRLFDRCRDNMFRSDNLGVGISHPDWNYNIQIVGV